MSGVRPIPVVCAVTVDEHGRVLLAQRPAHKHLGGKWEFPGGKVEPGEDPRTALRRELQEELGCCVEIGAALPEFDHDYGTVAIRMLPFICRLEPGTREPHPHEHVALRWVTLAELRTMDLAPADWPVVDAYENRKSESGDRKAGS